MRVEGFVEQSERLKHEGHGEHEGKQVSLQCGGAAIDLSHREKRQSESLKHEGHEGHEGYEGKRGVCP